jgi:hypothetical protein
MHTSAPGQKQRNWENDTHHNIAIEDLRGKESSVTLDDNGFVYGDHAPTHTTFANDAEIEAEYYPESSELIKQVTGASRVVFFDHSEPILSFWCPLHD